MSMPPTPSTEREQDHRFPSGAWTGFFLQPSTPGRHWMELTLTFQNGVVKGDGRDWVGRFLITGRYDVSDGKCHWTKAYIGKHNIFYRGYNEGKGIWGTWEFSTAWRGGFHIWPEGMSDPTRKTLAETQEFPTFGSEEFMEPSGRELEPETVESAAVTVEAGR
jgi:hypothetical protein